LGGRHGAGFNVTGSRSSSPAATAAVRALTTFRRWGACGKVGGEERLRTTMCTSRPTACPRASEAFITMRPFSRRAETDALARPGVPDALGGGGLAVPDWLERARRGVGDASATGVGELPLRTFPKEPRRGFRIFLRAAARTRAACDPIGWPYWLRQGSPGLARQRGQLRSRASAALTRGRGWRSMLMRRSVGRGTDSRRAALQSIAPDAS
jgi:hypothetical protein